MCGDGVGMVYGGGTLDVRGVGDLLGFGVPWARLPESVYPSSVFPLGLLYTDPVRQHPGSLYAPVCDMHQRE